MKTEPSAKDQEKLRIDKWLWAARFFKTRSLASEAVDAGKVRINGARIKPAKAVNIGDQLLIHQGRFELAVTVLGLSARRGPSSEAVQLYRESEESRAAREALAAQMKIEAEVMGERKGRPTKRDRRHIVRFIEES